MINLWLMAASSDSWGRSQSFKPDRMDNGRPAEARDNSKDGGWVRSSVCGVTNSTDDAGPSAVDSVAVGWKSWGQAVN